jgi:hypothetical protein
MVISRKKGGKGGTQEMEHVCEQVLEARGQEVNKFWIDPEVGNCWNGKGWDRGSGSEWLIEGDESVRTL